MHWTHYWLAAAVRRGDWLAAAGRRGEWLAAAGRRGEWLAAAGRKGEREAVPLLGLLLLHWCLLIYCLHDQSVDAAVHVAQTQSF